MEENTIARQNTDRLASLSVMFCLVNGINPTDELCQAIALTVMANLYKWYSDRGLEFNPKVNLIEEEAIKFAFEKVQEIAVLASIEAQTGIGMEGFGE